MNKSSISGWKDIYIFTLFQTLKSKAFLISYIVFLVLATATIPVMAFLTSEGSEKANTITPIKKVYVKNDTTLPNMDFSGLKLGKAFAQVAFEAMWEDYDTVSDRIEKEEHASVILTISVDNSAYSLNFVKSADGPIKDEDLSLFCEAFAPEFTAFKIKSLGVTTEQQAMINTKVETVVSLLDVDGNVVVKEDTKISFGEYWFIYAIMFTVLMVVTIASAQIASSLVTEKSTRVIEYLLISVKPLALILGKILAMLTAVVIEVISLILMVFLSSNVAATAISGDNTSILSQYLPSNIFENLNVGNVVMCLLFIVLGLIFYASLAGLAGSTVSRIEELQEGLVLFTFTSIIGAYIGVAAINILMNSGNNAFVTFAFLCPLSSPFLVPGSLLDGKISLPLAAGSVALLILSNILMLKFVAKVFETLILHTGNKIKIKNLLKLTKK